MDHPLRSNTYKSLRARVVQFISESYNIATQSNIVFVCGGNDVDHMRKRFLLEFPKLLPNHTFFEPEYAMQSYYSMDDPVPFDIAKFEELVGELSHSIVLFPEAPGSFAETGYFSAIEKLVSKTLLVIDSRRQKTDSFISIGPAVHFDKLSKFGTRIHMDYSSPDFSLISSRLNERRGLNKIKRQFKIKKFRETSEFELFSLVQELVYTLRAATLEDLEYFLKSLYNGHIQPTRIRQIVSILVGSKRLSVVGQFGHLVVSRGAVRPLELRDRRITAQQVLALDIGRALSEGGEEFRELLMEVTDAD